MATKKYDIAVKTGTYTSGGVEKARYENIGAVMQNDKGPYLMLKRTFNPAGVPNQDDRDSILCSLFEPKQDSGQAAKTGGYRPSADLSDDVPF